MTTKQAFAVGFLARCADEGLDATATESRLARGLEKRAGALEWIKGILGAGAGLSKATLTAAAVVPPIAGTAIGYLAGLETNPDQQDVESLKQEELIAEYRRRAEQARRASQRRTYRAF